MIRQDLNDSWDIYCLWNRLERPDLPNMYLAETEEPAEKFWCFYNNAERKELGIYSDEEFRGTALVAMLSENEGVFVEDFPAVIHGGFHGRTFYIVKVKPDNDKIAEVISAMHTDR